jgi:hypothetical protein
VLLEHSVAVEVRVSGEQWAETFSRNSPCCVSWAFWDIVGPYFHCFLLSYLLKHICSQVSRLTYSDSVSLLKLFYLFVVYQHAVFSSYYIVLNDMVINE